MCGAAGGGTFPTFDRRCGVTSDCFPAVHQTDCCGSLRAIGTATSQRAAFQAAEMTCRAMYPGCGCAPRPTQTDDGATTTDPMLVAVSCEAGTCTTRVNTPPTPRQHRASDAACATAPPPGGCVIPAGPPVLCSSDGDCTSGRNGRCVNSAGGVLTCLCTYDTCASDRDCTAGGPCACHGEPYAGQNGNTCVPGNCRTDADCGAGGFCSPSQSQTGCGGLGGYYCHTRGDLCVDDEDCVRSGTGSQTCAFISERARWECTQVLLCG